MFPTSSPIVSGSGSVVLNEVAGIYEEDRSESSMNALAERRYMLQHVQSHNFLDTQQYIITGQTLNSGTAYQFFLDQFNTLSAGIVLLIKPTGMTNLNNGTQKYMNLYSGTLDILNTTGDSLYGGGTNVPANYIKDVVVAKHWQSRYFQNTSVYVIPFGSNTVY